MVTAGIGMIILGYAFAYSGISQLSTGGKGWGLIQSITGHGTGSSATKTNAIDTLFSNVTPQGNSGSTQPATGTSPISGVQAV